MSKNNGITYKCLSATDPLLLLVDPTATVITALDCAYHFSPSRRAFFDLAALHPNKPRLALTDVILKAPHSSFLKGLFLKLACRAMGIPAANVMTKGEYMESLAAAGFKDITITTLPDDAVFLGFASHVQRRKEACLATLVEMGLDPIESSRLVDGSFAHLDASAAGMRGGGAAVFSYVVVTARQ